MSVKRIELSKEMPGEHPRIVIVASKTNDFCTSRLLEGALNELNGCAEATVVEVAGAFEVTAAAAAAFANGADGVIALGAVIRGDTPHFEYICESVTQGLTRLAAEGMPVAFGILTTNDVQQAADRSGGALGNKGAEAAQALLQSISAIRRMKAGA